MIEAGLRSKPAIHDSNRLVTKKPAARNAVVRVSTLAVPRPVMKPLVELTSPATLGLLQQHDADQAEDQHEVDDDNDTQHR